MEWQDNFKNKFSDIINQYELKYIELNSDNIVLIGNDFSLYLTVHFDNLFVEYIMRNDGNIFISYNIASFIVSKFDDFDRANIGSPKNVADTLNAIFTVWSRGLPKHWGGLLRGDRSWLESYKNYELSGKAKKVHSSITNKLKDYL